MRVSWPGAFPLHLRCWIVAKGEVELGRLLRRAAELSMALPNQAADRFAEESKKIDAAPPSSTEAVRLVKQRVGQDIYRQALMDYWGGACAVTGLAVPELLRASHAKPWADCASDEERLNVFNGLLLAAHLDALFDRGFLTFGPDGEGILSPELPAAARAALGLATPLRLRWLSPSHLTFLDWHRGTVFRA